MSESFKLNITSPNGDITITVAYPEGRALDALGALQQAATAEMDTLIYNLRNDPQVANKLHAEGLSFEGVDVGN